MKVIGLVYSSAARFHKKPITLGGRGLLNSKNGGRPQDELGVVLKRKKVLNIFANEFKKILFACIDLLENQELDNEAAAGLDNIIRYTCYSIIKGTNLCYIDVYKLVSLLKREWADINVLAEYKY